jgi:hypothetical protein
MRAPERKGALLVFDHSPSLFFFDRGFLAIEIPRSCRFVEKIIFAGKSFSAIGPTFATKNRSADSVFALGR